MNSIPNRARRPVLITGITDNFWSAFAIPAIVCRPLLVPRAPSRTFATGPRLSGPGVAHHQLITLMVTHSMAQALDHGQRTVMLHEGYVS